MVVLTSDPVEAAARELLVEKNRDQNLLFAAVSACLKHNYQNRASVLLQRILDAYQCQFPAYVDTASVLKCAIRLHLAVIDRTQAKDQHVVLAMLTTVFHYAARFSRECNATGSARQCSTMDCRWFQRTAFNTAQHYANLWPHRFLVDILQHGMDIVHPPSPVETAGTSILEHQVNSTFLRGLLLTAQAREWDPLSNTLEDLPRTSYSSRKPPSPGFLQHHLYQFTNQSFRELVFWSSEGRSIKAQHTVDAFIASGKLPAHLLDDIQLKAATLLPLSFDAELFIALFDVKEYGTMTSFALNSLIDEAAQITSSATVYAVIADTILSSTLPNEHDTEREVGMPARLPLDTAIELLCRIVTVIRTRPDYDVAKAARWVRCVIQTILDANTSPGIKSEVNTHLDLVSAMTTGAVQLARLATQSVRDYFHLDRPKDMDLDDLDTRVTPPESYPADELQWLSTTLFNLAIDIWVGGRAEEAQSWAGKAVEVADVLASMQVADGGDDGELRGKLRERGGMVGWVL
jgi:hypothetical protein